MGSQNGEIETQKNVGANERAGRGGNQADARTRCPDIRTSRIGLRYVLQGLCRRSSSVSGRSRMPFGHVIFSKPACPRTCISVLELEKPVEYY